jgi:hypothetical protein
LTAHLIRLLELYIERDALLSQLRACGVPFWPWDSVATLRRRLGCATLFGYPSEGADSRWLSTLEGKMMMAELRLMRALGVAKR